MFKKLLAPVLVVSLFISLCVSLPAQAAATKELKINKRNANEVSKIFENLKDKDPQKAISQKLSKDKRNPDELVSDQSETLQIKFSLKDKKIKLNNKLKGDLSLKIPDQNNFDSVDVIDNKVIYSGQNSKTDLIVESVEGGLRQIVNIKDASASNFYDFPVEIASGDKLELTENGGAVVKTSEGKIKAMVAKPWSIDANKKELKTWYTLEANNTLRQHIDLKNAVFPVVADPYWCGDGIWKIFWENRATEGGWTLRVFPTYCGRAYDGGFVFDEVLSKAPANNLWPQQNRNYTSNQGRSMYNQYKCHAYFAYFWKESYNLEPWRPLVEWRQLINQFDSRNNSMCNPK